MRLIPSDVGRPILDLVPRLRYAGLAEDARQVLSSLIFKEAEMQGEEGGWYFMRILPYPTTDNVIDGLVMAFIDITKIKVLQENQQRLMYAVLEATWRRMALPMPCPCALRSTPRRARRTTGNR